MSPYANRQHFDGVFDKWPSESADHSRSAPTITAREILTNTNKIFAEMFTFSDSHLDIKAINHNTLDPVPLHQASHLNGRSVRHQGTNEIQSGIDARGVACGSDDPESTKAHRGTTGNRLAASIGALEGDAALSVDRSAIVRAYQATCIVGICTYRALEGRRPSGLSLRM